MGPLDPEPVLLSKEDMEACLRCQLRDTTEQLRKIVARQQVLADALLYVQSSRDNYESARTALISYSDAENKGGRSGLSEEERAARSKRKRRSVSESPRPLVLSDSEDDDFGVESLDLDLGLKRLTQKSAKTPEKINNSPCGSTSNITPNKKSQSGSPLKRTASFLVLSPTKPGRSSPQKSVCPSPRKLMDASPAKKSDRGSPPGRGECSQKRRGSAQEDTEDWVHSHHFHDEADNDDTTSLLSGATALSEEINNYVQSTPVTPTYGSDSRESLAVPSSCVTYPHGADLSGVSHDLWTAPIRKEHVVFGRPRRPQPRGTMR